MRNQGWDEEAIEEERAAAAELSEPGLIWKENWPAIVVFTRCEWTKLVGMGGLVWSGIAASEIEAVLKLTKVPRDQWTLILDGVRLMVKAALPHINAKQED